MNPTLKTISKEGIPEALSKAERYRLLNEPGEAESICRDVMAVEPDQLRSSPCSPAACATAAPRSATSWRPSPPAVRRRSWRSSCTGRSRRRWRSPPIAHSPGW